MKLKKPFQVSLSICFLGVLLCNSVSCGQGLKVKVYYIDAQQGGLVRKQGDPQIPHDAFIPFSESTGFYCTSASDMEAVINALAVCKKEIENP